MTTTTKGDNHARGAYSSVNCRGKPMKSLLAATALALTLGSAQAANIITFSQTSGANTVFATTNAADTATTITIDDATISIGSFIAGSPPATSFLSLNATSIDPAVTFLGAVIQHYNGNFCITTAINCGGTNLLSGNFSDATFGALGGPGLVVNVNNPPDTLTLTSGVVAPTDLQPPSSFNLGFSNLTPVLHIIGTTIADFNAAFAGTVSASTSHINVPEPGSMAILGIGAATIGLIRRRRRSV